MSWRFNRRLARAAAALALVVVAVGVAPASADPGPVRIAISPEQAKIYEQAPVIELVTMGIGSLIWERHGHIALCVTRSGVLHSLRNPDPALDRCYNYGIGDFHEPLKMVWGFFRGANSFWVGRDLPGNMLQIYLTFDRTVWVQPLPLTDPQKQEIIAKLEHDILPDNRFYAYDHFDDNCTTRIRDIIDHATGGALASMTEPTDGKTYRDLARDGFQGMRIPSIITDIAMGRSTDRVPSYWERMFLPQFLREAVQKRWGMVPVPIYIRTECRGTDASFAPPDDSCVARGIHDAPAPSGRVLFGLLVIALGGLAALARWRRRFMRTTLALLVVPYALLGTILVFLAIISPLPYVHINETCLIWLPLDFALLVAPARFRWRYAQGRVVMLALLALLMVVGVVKQPLWAPWLWAVFGNALIARERPASE